MSHDLKRTRFYNKTIALVIACVMLVSPDFAVGAANNESIAKHCPVEAECPNWAQSSMGPEKLVDGDRSTSIYTSSGSKNADTEKDIYITFDKAYTIEEVQIYPYVNGGIVDGFPKDFSVSLWDGSRWLEVAAKTDYNVAAEGITINFAAGDYRALRFCATKLGTTKEGSYALRLAEIEVYGRNSSSIISEPFVNLDNIAHKDNGTLAEADCPSWSSAARINDGDVSSNSVFSTSGYDSDKVEKDIYLTFDQTYAVKEIRLYPYVNNGKIDSFPKDFSISLWNGRKWVDVETETNCSMTAEDTYTTSFIPMDCRSVRIHITRLGVQTGENENRYALRMSEIEVYGVASSNNINAPFEGKSNIALKANGTIAEAECPGWAQSSMGPEKMIDGDRNTSNYTSSGCEEITEKDIYLVFDQTYAVNEIKLYPYVRDGKVDGFPKSFTVSLWNGTSWVEVADRTNYSLKEEALTFQFTAGDYRALRLHTTQNGEKTESAGYALRLSEIEVYGVVSLKEIDLPAVWIEASNLARKAEAQAECPDWAKPSMGPEKLIDGDRTSSIYTSFSSAEENTEKDIYLTLKNISKVNEIKLYPYVSNGVYVGGFPKDFTVSLWNGGEWIQIASETDYRASSKPYRIDLPNGQFHILRLWVHATKLDKGSSSDNPALRLSEIEVYGVETEAIRIDDYKGDRSKEQWKVPKAEGKVFAGWYADSNYETIYKGTTGLAYAKFVNEDVLSVKKQLKTGTEAGSVKTDIRFVTSIDTLDYKCVGFEVTVAGKQFNLVETRAYSSIKTDGVVSTQKPENAFCEDSKFFVLHSITGIPNMVFNETFTVKPYWDTLDGTRVYGTSAYFTINQKVVQDSSKLVSFDYGDVILHDGLFKDHYDGCMEYYDTLTADDLLWHWRTSYGLDTEDGRDLGWVNGDTNAECCVAQLISAKARRYAITRDASDLQVVQEIVADYQDIVKKAGTHPLMYNQYFYEKAIRAFLDIYEYCGIEEGYDIAKSLVDWGMQKEQFSNPDKLLGDIQTEWYTMGEALYMFVDVARDRGESSQSVDKYMEFAKLYDYTEFWDIFYNNKSIFDYRVADEVNSNYKDYFHAYSHLNSINSALEAYKQTGNAYYMDSAVKFFDWASLNQKFATGGYGAKWEYLMPAAQQVDWLRTNKERSTETQCTAYAVTNMSSRLIQHTGDSSYAQWMEDAFYNMSIASLETKDGKPMYYSKYSALGGNKYLREDWPWACCAGTRPLVMMEYLKNIYYNDTQNLYVNLYTNSSVNFTNANGNKITLTQNSSFPESSDITFTVNASSAENYIIHFRKPEWISDNVTVKVNGVKVSYMENNGWVAVNRRWNSGDIIVVTLPMKLYYDKIEQSAGDGVYALKYGPIALACALRIEYDNDIVSTLHNVVPIGQDPNALLSKGSDLTFTVKSDSKYVFKPYYEYKENQWYVLYMSTKEVSVK